MVNDEPGQGKFIVFNWTPCYTGINKKDFSFSNGSAGQGAKMDPVPQIYYQGVGSKISFGR